MAPATSCLCTLLHVFERIGSVGCQADAADQSLITL